MGGEGVRLPAVRGSRRKPGARRAGMTHPESGGTSPRRGGDGCRFRADVYTGSRNDSGFRIVLQAGTPARKKGAGAPFTMPRRCAAASRCLFFNDGVNDEAFFWGEGNPLISAVDARSFLRRNGHGLRPPFGRGWRTRGFPSPQAPHPSPNALFQRGHRPCGKYFSRVMCRLYFLFI